MDAHVVRALDRFVTDAREAFGDRLRSVVLFGSAAEDALRPTSDVNAIVVLSEFRADDADRARPAVRLAGAAIRLRPMFLLEREVADAAGAFAVKFDDVRRRHRVLHGTDPFAGLEVPRPALVARLRQVLLNLGLRLRERIVAVGDREEDLGRAVADASGPLRACAAEVLVLEGTPAASPAEALRAVAPDDLPSLSRLRAGETLPAGEARRLAERMVDVAERLRRRAEALG
jgi:predicted nucleotidyltransferase